MYQKRYPSLFNKRPSYINSSIRSVSQPTLSNNIINKEPIKENIEIIEPEKNDSKKVVIIEPEKVEPEQEQPKKEQEPKNKISKPRSEDKRRKKTDDELREKFMSKLCKSKKLSASEKTINEINETLEKADHDPEKLKEIEKETRKKLRILKNSYLFIDKDKKENN